MGVLQGKHIVLGISGSIAAYKAASLTRLLVKAGAEVQIVITPAGKEFITDHPLGTKLAARHQRVLQRSRRYLE